MNLYIYICIYVYMYICIYKLYIICMYVYIYIYTQQLWDGSWFNSKIVRRCSQVPRRRSRRAREASGEWNPVVSGRFLLWFLVISYVKTIGKHGKTMGKHGKPCGLVVFIIRITRRCFYWHVTISPVGEDRKIGAWSQDSSREAGPN